MLNNFEPVLSKIVELIEDTKSEDIKLFLMTDRSWIADYVILVSVKNALHSQSVFDALEKGLSPVLNKVGMDDFYNSPKVSGSAKSGWLIFDINSILIHLVVEDVRAFYKLDTLLERQGAIYHL